jgi:hypothetical protein
MVTGVNACAKPNYRASVGLEEWSGNERKRLQRLTPHGASTPFKPLVVLKIP